jgi:hypothetical protein
VQGSDSRKSNSVRAVAACCAKYFPNWENELSRGYRLAEISCTVLLRLSASKPKSLSPSRFPRTVLDGGMLYTGRFSPLPLAGPCRVGVLL